MWECQECGQENDDSFPHCMSCGVESDTAPPQPDPPAVPEHARASSAPKSEWELTRRVASVVSFMGWLTVVSGPVGLPIILRTTASGQPLSGRVLWALVLQVFAVCTIGLVLVLIGHVSRAVVDIREGKRS